MHACQDCKPYYKAALHGTLLPPSTALQHFHLAATFHTKPITATATVLLILGVLELRVFGC